MASHTSAIRNLPTVNEIGAQVREGKLSPVDSVQRSLDAIARLDGGIHTFREVWADRALQAARELEQSENLSELPLAGVPFALKEKTALENPFVQQLTSAGAIAVGTTVNPQFRTWGTTTLPGLAVDNPILPGRVGGNDWYGMSVQGVLTVNNEDLRLITKILTNGMVDAEDPAKTLPENFAVSVDTTAPVFGLKAAPEYVDAAQQAARVFADKGFAVTEKNAPYPLNPLPMLARPTQERILFTAMETIASGGRVG